MDPLLVLTAGGTVNKFTGWTFVFISLLKANCLFKAFCLDHKCNHIKYLINLDFVL